MHGQPGTNRCSASRLKNAWSTPHFDCLFVFSIQDIPVSGNSAPKLITILNNYVQNDYYKSIEFTEVEARNSMHNNSTHKGWTNVLGHCFIMPRQTMFLCALFFIPLSQVFVVQLFEKRSWRSGSCHHNRHIIPQQMKTSGTSVLECAFLRKMLFSLL